MAAIEDMRTLHRDLRMQTFMSPDFESNTTYPYLCFLECPTPLRIDLATLYALGARRDLREAMLESLILEGEQGVAHQRIRRFWILASGKKSARDFEFISDYREIKGKSSFDTRSSAMRDLEEWADGLTEVINGPENALQPLHYLTTLYAEELTPSQNALENLELITRDYLLHPVMGEAISCLSKVNVVTRGVVHGESLYEYLLRTNRADGSLSAPIWEIIRNQEFVTEESLAQLVHEAEEYSWEWALASHLWNSDIPAQESVLGRLQHVVNTSPWTGGGN